MNRTLLITGGAGFIGSHLILRLFERYPDYRFVNIDKLTYASDESYLDPIRSSGRYTFAKVDLVNKADVTAVFEEHKPDGIIHLAAETHVDNSISGPEVFVYSNVVGTMNLLELARRTWAAGSANRFHHVSTDEVYGSAAPGSSFREDTPYSPNSPYSASKAASDHLVRAYHTTYGLNVVVTNCSNNFGPHQHDEKLIPTIVRNALQGKDIPIYGKGENVRDWLFVKDHCAALDLVFHKGTAGETYNVGGENEWQNLALAKKILGLLDEIHPSSASYLNQIRFVQDRPGHDLRYSVNCAKIQRELGWEGSAAHFDQALRETLSWYVRKYGGSR